MEVLFRSGKYWEYYPRTLISKTTESAEVRLMERNGRALQKPYF